MNRKQSTGARVVRMILTALIVVFFLWPLAWMVLASFKTNAAITDPNQLFDFEPTLRNFSNVLITQRFSLFTFNSLFISAAATGMALLVGVPAAYAVARFSMNRAAGFVLFARIIPGVSLLIPWYYIFAQLGMVGSYRALILANTFVALPLVLAIMTGYFEGMSPELEEAAQIDGLTRFGAFLRITVRLSVPGIAAASILAFIFAWNNFLFSLVLSGRQTTTLPAAIFQFISYLGVDWGGLMAASVVITVPVMTIALFLQRYIVAGLTAGATKG